MERLLAPLFTTFIDNLDLVKQQLKDGATTRKPNKDFQLDEFWDKLGSVVKVVSHEATKMAISFSQPPHPSPRDCEILIGGMEKATLALVSVFYSLPQHYGVCLNKSTKSGVMNVIDELCMLVTTIRSQLGKQEKINVQTTGSVWEACDKITTLPRDNKRAVQMIMKDNLDLVKDALEEMEEAVNDGGSCDWGLDDDDGDEEERWTDDDRLLIKPCLALVTASKGFLKKSSAALSSHGQCDACDYITQMDTMGSYVERLSPDVDVLVSGLYAPLDHQAARNNATSLAELLKQSLEYFRSTHMCTESEVQWIDFLQKAIGHNLTKIDGIVK